MDSVTPSLIAIPVASTPTPKTFSFPLVSVTPSFIVKYEQLDTVFPERVEIIYTDVYAVSPSISYLRFLPLPPKAVLYHLEKVSPYLLPFYISRVCPERHGTALLEWADSYTLWTITPCIEERVTAIRAYIALRNYIADRLYGGLNAQNSFVDVYYVRFRSDGRIKFNADPVLSDAQLIREIAMGAGIRYSLAREFLVELSSGLKFLKELGVERVYMVALQVDLVNMRYTV